MNVLTHDRYPPTVANFFHEQKPEKFQGNKQKKLQKVVALFQKTFSYLNLTAEVFQGKGKNISKRHKPYLFKCQL